MTPPVPCTSLIAPLPRSGDGGYWKDPRKPRYLHTGIDVYVADGTPVSTILPGTVTAIQVFTGPKAGTPWWLDTQAVLVYHPDLDQTVVYGEINPVDDLRVGQDLGEGALLGHVTPVLKTYKGRNPTTMLHVELIQGRVTESLHKVGRKDTLGRFPYFLEGFYRAYSQRMTTAMNRAQGGTLRTLTDRDQIATLLPGMTPEWIDYVRYHGLVVFPEEDLDKMWDFFTGGQERPQATPVPLQDPR